MAPYLMRNILEQEILDYKGSNFTQWFQKLRMVLEKEEKEQVILSIPKIPDGTNDDEVTQYLEHIENEREVMNLILATIDPLLQEQFRYGTAFGTVNKLKKMFPEQVSRRKYELTKILTLSEHSLEKSVKDHVLKMMDFVKELESLGSSMDFEFSKNMIILSLPRSFGGFINHPMVAKMNLTEFIEHLEYAEDDIRSWPKDDDLEPKVKISPWKWRRDMKKVWMGPCPKYMATLRGGNVPANSGVIFLLFQNLI